MSRSRKILWTLAILVVGYIGVSSLPSGAAMLSGARSTEAETDELLARIALADEAAADPSFDASLEEARSAVPVHPELPTIIDLLDGAVRSAGMRWISGSPSAASSEGSGWTMALTLTGSARDTTRLLDALHTLPRLVVVDSVQVRGDVDATILLSVRFFTAEGDPESFRVETDKAASGQSPAQEG